MKQEKTKTEVIKVPLVSVGQTKYDLVLALLIVSSAINLFILIGWVALQVTTVYDAEVAYFLFVR